MGKFSIIVIPLILLMGNSALAAKVSKIVIKGHKKIEQEAILKKIEHKVGGSLSLDLVRKEVRDLFASGFFQDVIVEETASSSGVELTYTVVEKPPIREIVFKGNSALDDEELLELLKMKTFEIIDYGKITKGVVDIQKAFEDKGYFLAKVGYSIDDPNDQGVVVRFDITQNDKVMVKRVSFIGNENVMSSELKKRMAIKEGGLFSPVSGSGTFKQEGFERDLQLISFVYFNKGYVKAKVARPEVTVTPDQTGIYLTFRVEEGPRFNRGEVGFSGDMLFTDVELRDTISIDEASIFEYEKVQKDLQALQAKYGDLGYAYANIIPKTFIKEDERIVDITYEFDKGRKVYFGTINVIGNSRSRDKVVRRELRIGEGELYNETKKRESQNNIQRLGFFEQVTFNTRTPPGRDDVMDIDIVVKERNTGSFQVGAGYSSFSGTILNASLNQTNFLGRGWNVGFQLDYSRIQRRYRLSFTEPFFKDTLWSTGIDIYRNENNIPQYQRKVEGAALRVGHPIFNNRYLYGFIRYKFDDTNISLTPGRHATDILDRFAPSKGIHASLSYEQTGLGGQLLYGKANAFFRYYRRLFWNVVLRTNVTYGNVIGMDSSRDVPFDQRFRLGGPYNLRGYDFTTVGRKAYSPVVEAEALANGQSPGEARKTADITLGGTQQLYSMIELEFPLVKEAGIRGAIFYDIGLAEDDLVASEIRSDVGLGFRWFSPMGPLRFEWGFPLNRRNEIGDAPFKFHFAIGAPF